MGYQRRVHGELINRNLKMDWANQGKMFGKMFQEKQQDMPAWGQDFDMGMGGFDQYMPQLNGDLLPVVLAGFFGLISLLVIPIALYEFGAFSIPDSLNFLPDADSSAHSYMEGEDQGEHGHHHGHHHHGHHGHHEHHHDHHHGCDCPCCQKHHHGEEQQISQSK